MIVYGGAAITSAPWFLPPSNRTDGWRVVYQPDPGYSNDESTLDSFTYSVTDEQGLTYPLNVQFHVRVIGSAAGP